MWKNNDRQSHFVPRETHLWNCDLRTNQHIPSLFERRQARRKKAQKQNADGISKPIQFAGSENDDLRYHHRSLRDPQEYSKTTMAATSIGTLKMVNLE